MKQNLRWGHETHVDMQLVACPLVLCQGRSQKKCLGANLHIVCTFYDLSFAVADVISCMIAAAEVFLSYT